MAVEISSPIFACALLIFYVFVLLPILVKFADPAWFNVRGRNVNIEGLRGFLAIFVFFHHCLITYYFFKTNGTWDLTPSAFYNNFGFVGVTVFFFMTGFLFWTRASSGRYEPVREFFKRRALRLIPPFYIGTFAVLITIVIITQRFELRTILALIHWLTFGLPSSGFPDFNGYSNTPSVIAGVIWTLRYEWLFYFFYIFTRRFSSLGWTIALVLAMGAIHLGIRASFDQEALSAHHALLFNLFRLTRYFFPGFGFGMLVAHMQRVGSVRKMSSAPLSELIALALFVFVLFRSEVEANYIQNSIVLAISFLIFASSDRAFWSMKTRPVQVFGLTSYGIYLYHGLWLFWVMHGLANFIDIKGLDPIAYWLICGGIGSLALISAFVSYTFLELPLLGKSQVFRKKSESPGY